MAITKCLLKSRLLTCLLCKKSFKSKIEMNNKSSNIELWKKVKTNGHSKRKRRAVVAYMLSSRSNQQNQQNITMNSHSEHMELAVENASILDNSSIFEAENECEIANDWQIELSDDSFANTPVEEAIEDKNLLFVQDLANWSITHAIRRDALDELLGLLREANPKMNLPKHARTILKTPQQKQTIAQDGFGGEYWHYGLENALIACLKHLEYCPVVKININIDGLPLFESSKVQFWPILFNIHEKSNVPPMIIGIYCGTGEHIFQICTCTYLL